MKRSKGHGHGDTVKKAVTAKIDSEYIDLWRWLEVGVFVVVSWLSVDCDGCLRCVGTSAGAGPRRVCGGGSTVVLCVAVWTRNVIYIN